MKVVLLAGGMGTRISEESEYRPKPMVEIGGKPILWHIMKSYSYYGFNDFIVCAGYKQYEKNKETKFKSSDYTVGYVKADREKTWNLIETDWDAVMLPVRHAWSLCAGAGRVQTFAITQGDILKDILLDKKGWVDAKEKDVDGKKLPDWEKLSPPGGLIADDKAKEKKLDWVKLRDYLGH